MKIRVRSRHPSHRCLRRLINLPFRALINMGRTSEARLPSGRYVLLNPPLAVANAADKALTKQKFAEHGVVTAEYWPDHVVPEDAFPVVVKHRLGSRGTGVYLMETPAQLSSFRDRRGEAQFLSKFIVEKFKGFRYEYRLHATQTEVFLANRKARKEGVPVDQRWKHTYDNSVWFNEDNPGFKKPAAWEAIKAEACKAIAALGMDFGAVDVKVSTSGTKFFVIEVNSAPSLGEDTRQQYVSMIPGLAQKIKDTRGEFTKA